MYHIGRLADLATPEHADTPRWVNLMRARRRKHDYAGALTHSHLK
jgi:hypothetical protein